MKNFRLLLICAGLLFLDVASPFNACRDPRTTLEINTVIVDDFLTSRNEINSKIATNVTTLDSTTINNQVTQALKTGKYYSKEDKCYYEIEITLPYDFTEEDIIVYDTGKRNFIRLVVNVTIEYLIIPEEQPE